MPESKKRRKKQKTRHSDKYVFHPAAELLRRCSDDVLALYILLYGWHLLAPRAADEVYRCLLFSAALKEAGVASELWVADRIIAPFPEGISTQSPPTMINYTPELMRVQNSREERGPQAVLFVPSAARIIDLAPPHPDPVDGIPLVGRAPIGSDPIEMEHIAIGRPPYAVVYDFGPQLKGSDRRVSVPENLGDAIQIRQFVLAAILAASKVPGIRVRVERDPLLRALLADALEQDINLKDLPPSESIDVHTLFVAAEPGHPPVAIMELLGPSWLFMFERWCTAMGLKLLRTLPDRLQVLHGWTTDLQSGIIIKNHWDGLVLGANSVPDHWRDGLIREGACIFATGLNLGTMSGDVDNRPDRISQAAKLGWLAGGLVTYGTGRSSNLAELHPMTVRPEDLSP